MHLSILKLNQCFDLHEAPRDTQVWFSALAESDAISNEMHGEDMTAHLEVLTPPTTFNEEAEDALYCHDQPEISLVPPEVLEAWEMGQTNWMDTMENIEKWVVGQEEPLFYLPSRKEDSTEFADENDLPVVDAFKLPVGFQIKMFLLIRLCGIWYFS